MRALLCTALLSTLLPLAAQSANGHDDPPVLELSLSEAVDAFFENNLSLEGARLDAEASFAGFGASWGAFDTVFFVDSTRSEQISAPSGSNFVGGVDVGESAKTESDLWTLSTGLRGALPTGTTWEFSLGPTRVRTESRRFEVTRDEDTDDIIDTSFHKGESIVDTASMDFSVTHPFLRGGADGYARSALELAAKDVRLAEADFDTAAFDSLQEVITNYWNLVFANSDVATKELSVRLAEELLGITRRKFEQGLQNRIDVIEVEAEVARRNEELLTARNAAEDAVDALRKLIYAPETLEEWQVRILPLTSYEDIPEEYPNEAEALERALRLRPAVKRARLALDRAEIAARRAETEALPKLDATAGYGVNSNQRTLGLSLRELPDSSFHQASVTLSFEQSLVNRANGFAARQRRIERDRAALNLRQAQVDAIADVRSSVRGVDLQRARVITTAEEARLRREAYEGEQRRLENDLSTPFQVRESQRDFLLAIDAQTRAGLDLAVARTSLAAAQGLLYEAFDYAPSHRELDLDQAPDLP